MSFKDFNELNAYYDERKAQLDADKKESLAGYEREKALQDSFVAQGYRRHPTMKDPVGIENRYNAQLSKLVKKKNRDSQELLNMTKQEIEARKLDEQKRRDELRKRMLGTATEEKDEYMQVYRQGLV